MYNYENPTTLPVPDVVKIQKNAYAYMLDGNLKWEKDKYQILEWIEEDIIEAGDGKKEEIVEGKEKKFKYYFTLLNKWMVLKSRVVSLVEFFRNNNMQKIAIYGGGEIACRLIRELKDRK